MMYRRNRNAAETSDRALVIEKLVDDPDLSLDAAPFLETACGGLGFVAQDNRCFDLHRDVMLDDMMNAKEQT